LYKHSFVNKSKEANHFGRRKRQSHVVVKQTTNNRNVFTINPIGAEEKKKERIRL